MRLSIHGVGSVLASFRRHFVKFLDMIGSKDVRNNLISGFTPDPIVNQSPY